MSQGTVYVYATTSEGGNEYSVSAAHEDLVGSTVEASYSPGDQFVVDGQVYTAAGAADAVDGGKPVGLFAYNADGQLVFFSTTAISGSENVYLNTEQNDFICFMAGTRIATPGGVKNVECLAIGDSVLTADGKVAPVRWVGRQTVSTLFADPKRVMPIRICAGALGERLPERDLLVSPSHALLVDGVLVQAGALVNGSTIVRETNVPQTFVYYHVELENHSLIVAEGLPAETFLDNVERMAFDNWDEHLKLYPKQESIPEMSYPRASSARQLPASIVAKLSARTVELVGPVEAAA